MLLLLFHFTMRPEAVTTQADPLKMLTGKLDSELLSCEYPVTCSYAFEIPLHACESNTAALSLLQSRTVLLLRKTDA